VNVEQGKRTILFWMIGKSTLISIGVDFTLDSRNLWRLSHFHSLFLSFSYSTYIHRRCKKKKLGKIFFFFGTIFALVKMGKIGQKLVVSRYSISTYDEAGGAFLS
jgi:hypothetical protein